MFGAETEPETIVGARHASPLPQRTAQAAVTRSYTEFWKGVDIDRAMLGKALPRLPETAAELRAVAQNLGAPASEHPSAPGRERDDGEAVSAFRLSRRLFRHPRPGCRRGQGIGRAVARAHLAEAAERYRRRSPHRQRGGAAQAQRRLGRALRLQHHRRRQARRRGAVRPRPRLLLCRRPRAPRLALGGGNQCRDAAHHRRPSTS